MTNKVYSRFSKISNGQVSDSSDEYYTLYHAYCSLVLELMCRYKKGKRYKVIICPCDSSTSIFRNLEKLAEKIGNPRIIYSFYPEVDWSYYFDLDYEKEYGCAKDEVLIFTNPPFKKLSKNLELIKCDYLLFGSNAVGISQGVYAKETKGFVYIKNTENYNGNADDFQQKFGAVNTWFYSNSKFLSYGRQYTNKSDKKESLLFGRDRLYEVRDENNG